GRALDVADALGLVRPLAALVELPIDRTRQDVLADRQAEHLVRQVDLADLLVVQVRYGALHDGYSLLSAAAGAWAAAVVRSAAGNGTSLGSLRLTASRTRT